MRPATPPPTMAVGMAAPADEDEEEVADASLAEEDSDAELVEERVALWRVLEFIALDATLPLAAVPDMVMEAEPWASR